MIKKFLTSAFLLLVIFFIGCEQDVIDPLKDKGTIFVDSKPEEASIYVDGRNTSKLTPSAVEVVAGIHHVTLKKLGYRDYNFTDTVTIGNESSFVGIEMFRLALLNIQSDPSNATIILDGINTTSKTPKVFSKDNARYEITLKVENYYDSTFTAEIINAQDLDINIYLRPKFVTRYSGVVLYDTTNAAANQPSGVNLETGNPLLVTKNSGQSNLVDLFFSPSEFGGYEIRTASGTNGMIRDTRFKVSKSENINDGVDSPSEDPTWRNSFPFTTNNYVFCYDSGGHYSKLQIVRVLDNPKRVEVRWIYNDNTFDTAF